MSSIGDYLSVLSLATCSLIGSWWSGRNEQPVGRRWWHALNRRGKVLFAATLGLTALTIYNSNVQRQEDRETILALRANLDKANKQIRDMASGIAERNTEEAKLRLWQDQARLVLEYLRFSGVPCLSQLEISAEQVRYAQSFQTRGTLTAEAKQYAKEARGDFLAANRSWNNHLEHLLECYETAFEKLKIGEGKPKLAALFQKLPSARRKLEAALEASPGVEQVMALDLASNARSVNEELARAANMLLACEGIRRVNELLPESERLQIPPIYWSQAGKLQSTSLLSPFTKESLPRDVPLIQKGPSH